MSEWKERTLDDVADIIPGYAFKSKHFGNEGVPVIKITDIEPPFVNVSGAMRVDLTNYDENKLSKYKLLKNDFVVAMTGATIGKVGRLVVDASAIINQRVAKIAPKKNTHRDFVYYCLQGGDFQGFIQNNIDSHSAQENISGTSIGRYPILLPSPDEQKAIASVLSSLDDKIDLLHRQNKTLEAMAETLFRQWFVEEAQEDWEEKPLFFFGDIICGKTPSKKILNYFDGEIPFIKIPDMHGNVFLFETSDSLTEEGKLSQSNKTLPPKSICVSCIATVGLVSMNAKESQTNQQINSIIPRKDCYRYFLYLTMKLSYDLLHSMASGGTATLNLNTGNFSKIPVQYPGDDFLIVFQREIEPYFNKIFINQTQISTLEKLRDTLLPKLMSGEVRVEYEN